MNAEMLRVVALLSVAVGALAQPALAASPSIVASVFVVTGQDPSQVSEHTIAVGKELTLYSGAKYRITALPKEVDIARVLMEFKLIPVESPGEQTVPPGKVEGSLQVGKGDQIILGAKVPSQTDPQIIVTLRSK
jgi:hypothetical protein